MRERHEDYSSARSAFPNTEVESDSTIRNWLAFYLCIIGGKRKSGTKREFTVDEALAAMGCSPRKEGFDGSYD